MKIKNQLLLTHGLLVILSLIIVLTNMVAYNGISSDASLINQSGKLRALSYNMAQLANQITNQYDEEYSIKLSEDLQQRIDDFDSALTMLGGNTDYSKLSFKHNQTIVRLENITLEWEEVFKPLYIKVVIDESNNTMNKQINTKIHIYVNDIDEMVKFYSIYSTNKVHRALAINGGLVFLIIIITLYSFTSTFNKIQKPMSILMEELKELSLIDNEVSKKLKDLNTDEISEMTHYFNEMLYDQLTLTYNRRSGLAKLNKLLQFDNRRSLKMSLCYIDINGLKVVNDQLGHKFGDELIVSTVDTIKQEIRDDDFIIRMGGDEFVIVFRGINEIDSEKVWDRINDRYQAINEHEGRPYLISVSHGVAEYDNLEKSKVELLIKNADIKMYAEKKYIKKNLKVEIIKDI